MLKCPPPRSMLPFHTIGLGWVESHPVWAVRHWARSKRRLERGISGTRLTTVCTGCREAGKDGDTWQGWCQGEHTMQKAGWSSLIKRSMNWGPAWKIDLGSRGGCLPPSAQSAVLPALTEHIGGHPQQGVEHVVYLTVSLDHIG